MGSIATPVPPPPSALSSLGVKGVLIRRLGIPSVNLSGVLAFAASKHYYDSCRGPLTSVQVVTPNDWIPSLQGL